MYTPSAYYLAHVGAGLIIFVTYPLVTGLISYWNFGFEDPTWSGCFTWMFCLSLPALLGSLWGFTFGTFFRSEATALQFNLVFLLLFNSGAGHTSNLGKGVNYFAKLISTLSPVRYGTEMLMTQIVKGNPAEPFILNHLGYTTGNGTCVLAMVILGLIIFFVGWANMLRTNRFE